jgi:hexulose-6-phosphate isomerase
VNPIGIMQGRLSVPAPDGARQLFPSATWRQEFGLAAQSGFDCLEWLVTADRLSDNPICTASGVAEIAAQCAATGVTVPSLCADCFIARPFVHVDQAARRDSIAILEGLIEQSAQAGIAVVLIPLLDAGEIRDAADARVLRDSLHRPMSLASASGVRLAIESDMPGPAYRELVASLGAGACAYYDAGNAAARGYDIVADLRVLGPALAGVHIKDRRRSGPSVPLGEGDVDFDALFAGVAGVGYVGALVLETPAGAEPLVAAQRQLAFARTRQRAASLGVAR